MKKIMPVLLCLCLLLSSACHKNGGTPAPQDTPPDILETPVSGPDDTETPVSDPVSSDGTDEPQSEETDKLALLSSATWYNYYLLGGQTVVESLSFSPSSDSMEWSVGYFEGGWSNDFTGSFSVDEEGVFHADLYDDISGDEIQIAFTIDIINSDGEGSEIAFTITRASPAEYEAIENRTSNFGLKERDEALPPEELAGSQLWNEKLALLSSSTWYNRYLHGEYTVIQALDFSTSSGTMEWKEGYFASEWVNVLDGSFSVDEEGVFHARLYNKILGSEIPMDFTVDVISSDGEDTEIALTVIHVDSDKHKNLENGTTYFTNNEISEPIPHSSEEPRFESTEELLTLLASDTWRSDYSDMVEILSFSPFSNTMEWKIGCCGDDGIEWSNSFMGSYSVDENSVFYASLYDKVRGEEIQIEFIVYVISYDGRSGEIAFSVMQASPEKFEIFADRTNCFISQLY